MAQGYDPSVPATRAPVESLPVRTNLKAVASDNSGTIAPADPIEGMSWLDTSDPTNIKLKKYVNGAWFTILNDILAGAPSQSTVEKYTHTQSSASSTWVINHGLGTTNVQITFWDGSNQLILPDTATLTSNDVITAVFETPQSGKAIVVG